MLALSSPFTLGFAPVAPAMRGVQQASANVRMETVADLKELASKCNPTIGYFNPLSLGESSPGSAYDTEAAIGYLRHAEIKHGRVAMAAFVGFIVQSNGIHFPWNIDMQTSYASLSEIAAPAAQWDALSTAAKLQIFGAIFLLELWSEGAGTHYMRGGKPGEFPSFDPLREAGKFPHPIPFDLFDPFGFSKNATPEKKARGLICEINNGRAAQIGIMAFVSEAKVPGSVPALKGLIAPYDGECMAPFSASDNLPYVAEMLKYELPISQWW